MSEHRMTEHRMTEHRMTEHRMTEHRMTERRMTVQVLNGPNLGRLGRREPDVYGHDTYADLVAACEQTGSEVGLDVVVRQTDSEAELIGWLHEAADAGDAVVLNAAALTHTSIAVRDAASQLTAPLVEVHLSNIAAREPFRHHSHLSAVATGVVTGLGLEGYRAAIRAIAGIAAAPR